MQLHKLIEHIESIYKISLKTTLPPDILLRNLYIKKKYIGSKERKFINELTFSSLRLKFMNDFVVSEVLKTFIDNGYFITSKINFNNDEKKFVNIVALFSTLASEISLFDHQNLKIALNEAVQLYDKSNAKELAFYIINALSEFFNKNNIFATKFWDCIVENIKKLDSECQALLGCTTPDLQNIKLLEARYSMPSWILLKWVLNKYYPFSIKDACQLAESYIHPAPITLRVNTELISRLQVIDILQKENVEAEEGKLSTSSIIIKKRIPLTGMNIYRNGLVEAQDEGSQLVSFVLAPTIGSSVLDACAGAGGKTMHIASIMKDSGEIIACDTDYHKLKEIKFRAERQNFRSIKTIHIKKEIPQDLSKGFDYVLIDAPCSGMGTIRRIPNPKWMLTKDALERYSSKQFELLSFYSQFVNPGGVLVYSTCSSMFEENDEVIDKFLNENKDFIPDPIPNTLKNFNIDINYNEVDDYKLHLFTHIYGCDTFFICRMKKIV